MKRGLVYSLALVFIVGLIGGSSALTEEETIKILGTVAFSGVAANIGPPYDRAMRLAIDEINAAGIEGFSRIEYKVIDTETDPAKFRQKLLREIETWQPDIAGGAALETTITPVCVIAPEYKLPNFVGGHLSMSKYLPPGEVPLSPYVIYFGCADIIAGQFAGQFFEEMGCKKVALLAGDYDWGYTNGMGLKLYWETHDQPFEIGPILYTPLDKTDYSAEMQIMKQEKPDAVFIPYSGAGWMSAVTQMKDAGVAPRIILYATTYSNMGGAKVTGEYGAEGIYTLSDHNPTTDAWHKYVDDWRAAYGAKAYPEAYTNCYYDMIYWIKEVYEKAGSKDPEAFIAAAQETQYQGVCISPMGPMGPDGENLSADVGVVQFLPGSSSLDPSFGLHPVLVRHFTAPDWTTREIYDMIVDYDRLRPELEYPAK